MLSSDNSSIKFTPKTNDDYSSSSSAVRPNSSPTTGKDFKKVLGQKERKGQKNQGNEKAALENEGLGLLQGGVIESTPPPPSLFDLSKGKKGDQLAEEEAALLGAVPPKEKESPGNLFRKLSSKDKGKAVVGEDDKKKKTVSHFPQEQPDLAAINPNPQQENQSIEFSTKEIKIEKPSLAPHLKEVVDKLVDKLYIMQRNGQTETVISLKGPTFQGANLVVTSFETARGEFNIRFENLTAAAQQLIVAQQYSLQHTLKEKGYTVHILTASTTSETPILLAEDRFPEKGDDQQQQQPQRDSSGDQA